MRKKGILTLCGSIILVLVFGALPFLAACTPSTPAPTTAPPSSPTSAPTTTPGSTTVPTPTPAPAPAKPIELRVHSHFATNHVIGKIWEEWGKKIEEETNGRVKFTVYVGAVLASGPASYDAVVGGIADAGSHIASYTVGRFPLTEVVSVPGPAWNDAKHGANVLWSLYETFPEIKDELKQTHLLWLMPPPSAQIHSMKPAPHVADLKGLKIRTQGLSGPVLQELGAVSIQMNSSEIYESLSKGVLDATLHPWETTIAYGWWEVAKNSTQTDFFVQTVFIGAMNTQTYNRLPEDIKQVVDKYSGRYASVDLFATRYDEGDISAFEKLKADPGMSIYKWTEEDIAMAAELSKPVVDKWKSDMAAKGLGTPAQKIYDEMLKLNQQYK